MTTHLTHLTTAQLDRATGVLLGTAAGDALGVPYEFDSLPLPLDGEPAQMLGGGLGNFAPGEWSDDTSMAMAIAEVAATGADLTTDDALDAIADNFLRWYDGNPPDVGNQTRAVLSATRRRLNCGEHGTGRIMRDESDRYAASHPRSAGNGALNADRAGCVGAPRRSRAVGRCGASGRIAHSRRPPGRRLVCAVV
ncbi:ADP-ribosylglycohydrolase family protein [Gordonia sp. DT101]|uniref:ADP-ribosylglycohydrolase family protein n=1 Tax=Gordonia sp. DT101 TaxID=3416545 RepID=UPI003CEED03B